MNENLLKSWTRWTHERMNVWTKERLTDGRRKELI